MKTLTITRNYSTPAPVYPRYAQVMNHCQYTKSKGLKIQNILDFTGVEARINGIPSVRQRIQTAQEKPVVLTRPLQEWMFSIFEECAPPAMARADIIKCWASTLEGWRAFTNKTGWDDGYADYIQGVNLGSSPMKLQPTICHGATIKVLRPPWQKGDGTWLVAFEILDAFDPATLERTYANSRHLIFPAINWARYPLPYGQADPFPKLGGRDVPIPMLGNRVTESYIELEWIRWLDNEPVPANPYWRGF